MFKYTIMIATVVVVSASLANSVPANSSRTAANQYDPMYGAATAHKNKQAKPDNYQPIFAAENVGSSLLESALSHLLEAINVPKKIIGNAINGAVGLLKSVDLAKAIRIALIGGAVVVLGAVAAAGAAGIAAIVTAVCAVLPYYRFFFGNHKGEATDSEMDVISEFVLSAFNKYDSQHRT